MYHIIIIKIILRRWLLARVLYYIIMMRAVGCGTGHALRTRHELAAPTAIQTIIMTSLLGAVPAVVINCFIVILLLLMLSWLH
jgi:hypothetical protein